MKIQCDVCNRDEASVFCVADEAAICAGCDDSVHHANKLASKHHRFSLLHPSANQFTLCDVCQERRAFLFCHQDRAMLCRDCDHQIHSANEHTKKHDRFLLTGIKLSATSDLYDQSKSTLTKGDGSIVVPDLKLNPMANKSASASSAMSKPGSLCESSSILPLVMPTNKNSDEDWKANGGDDSASSLSKYLIETLPGWHVEDLLDSSPPCGFCKSDDDSTLPTMDDELENSLSVFWVPQTASSLQPAEMRSGENVFNESEESNIKAIRGGWIDDGFTVPQISPSFYGLKRSRPFW